MAGTIVVDRIESDASYASNINVASQITFSNTVNFGITSVVPVAGFYSPSTNNVAFTTASTERMRIIPSGNVLIGTTTTQTGAVLAVTGGIQGTISSGTAVASTSGTSIDFTSIPSWVKRITVVFNGVSTNGSSMSLIQLGTGATTYTTSGYVSTSVGAAASPGASSYTSGFGIRNDDASYVMSGHMVITNISGNIWISSHTTRITTGVCPIGGGSVTLGATLTAVRITTVNGSDTYDAGSINILYEG